MLPEQWWRKAIRPPETRTVCLGPFERRPAILRVSTLRCVTQSPAFQQTCRTAQTRSIESAAIPSHAGLFATMRGCFGPIGGRALRSSPNRVASAPNSSRRFTPPDRGSRLRNATQCASIHFRYRRLHWHRSQAATLRSRHARSRQQQPRGCDFAEARTAFALHPY